MLIKAKCFGCDMFNCYFATEGECFRDAKKHVQDGSCHGPVLIVDPSGLLLEFPQTILPRLVRRKAAVASSGIRE